MANNSQVHCLSQKQKLSLWLKLVLLFLIKIVKLAPIEVISCEYDRSETNFWITKINSPNNFGEVKIQTEPEIIEYNFEGLAKINMALPISTFDILFLLGEGGIYQVKKSDPLGPSTKLDLYTTTQARIGVKIDGKQFVAFLGKDSPDLFIFDFLESKVEKIIKSDGSKWKDNIKKIIHQPQTSNLVLNDMEWFRQIDHTTGTMIKNLLTNDESSYSIKYFILGRKNFEIAYTTELYFYLGSLTTNIIDEKISTLYIGPVDQIELYRETDYVLFLSKDTTKIYIYKLFGSGDPIEYNGKNYFFEFPNLETYLKLNSGSSQLAIFDRDKIIILDFFDDNLGCKDTNCNKCGIVEDFCVECKEEYWFQKGLCTIMCNYTDNYYDVKDRACKRKICPAGSYFDGHLCIICESPTQGFDFETGKCIECSNKFGKECTKCLGGVCYNCNSPFVLSNDFKRCICKQASCCSTEESFDGNECQCIGPKKRDNEDFLCKTCQEKNSNCLSCNELECTSCEKNFELENKICVCKNVQCCAEGQIYDNGCKDCPTGFSKKKIFVYVLIEVVAMKTKFFLKIKKYVKNVPLYIKIKKIYVYVLIFPAVIKKNNSFKI